THRRSGEGVGAARVRQGRRHLGDRIDQAVVHDRHEHAGDGEPAEPARAQSEVPAVELAGDDGTDPEGPERPHARVTAQATSLEVALVDLLIRDRTELAFLRHVPPPRLLPRSPGY